MLKELLPRPSAVYVSSSWSAEDSREPEQKAVVLAVSVNSLAVVELEGHVMTADERVRCSGKVSIVPITTVKRVESQASFDEWAPGESRFELRGVTIELREPLGRYTGQIKLPLSQQDYGGTWERARAAARTFADEVVRALPSSLDPDRGPGDS